MESLNRAIRRTLLKLGNSATLTDGQLLAQFVASGEQSAFEELVRRYGPMVLRVCQRVLNHGQDAEDAFQATFIVLMRKARQIARPDQLANWLYGVAYRTALHARRQRAPAGQGLEDRLLEDRSSRRADAEVLGRELRGELDHALQHLPEKYRAPMIFCYLEGKTNQEAAQLLRCQTGAVEMRLSRAREMLRTRLARRGMALSGAMLSTLLAQEGAGAAVPARLTASAVRWAAKAVACDAGDASALVLAEAVLRSMAPKNLKLLAAVLFSALLLGIVATGAALTPQQPQPQVSSGPPEVEVRAPVEGLVGYYAFNEGQGTRVGDGSPSGNHGALIGGATWMAGPKPGSKALSLDGKSGYIKFAQDLNQWLGGTATLSFWLKTTQAGRTQDWATPMITGSVAEAEKDDNDINWGILMASGRAGIAVGNQGGPGTFLTKRPINDGAWHHLALTRDTDSGNVQVFLDGTLEEEAVSKKGRKTTPFDTIGRWDHPRLGSFFFQASLSEMRLYNRVLRPEEVRTLTAALKTGNSMPIAKQPASSPLAGTQVSAIYAGDSGRAGSFTGDRGEVTGGTFRFSVAAIDTPGVSNPAPEFVYQTERFGNFTYTIPNLTPDSAYKVRLHFAETYWTAAGQRLFNVSINGNPVLSNFDIYATAGGKDIAIVREFRTKANRGGQIVVQFSTVKDNAKISGIEIYTVDP